MKKGRFSLIFVSKAQIWAGTDRDPVATGAPFLSRQFFDRKESAEDGLFAIEVQLIGIGEIAVDFIAQRRPAWRIGAGR